MRSRKWEKMLHRMTTPGLLLWSSEQISAERENDSPSMVSANRLGHCLGPLWFTITIIELQVLRALTIWSKPSTA